MGSPHVDRLAEAVTLRFARPETFTLDGELFREEEARIGLGPRVCILVP